MVGFLDSPFLDLGSLTGMFDSPSSMFTPDVLAQFLGNSGFDPASVPPPAPAAGAGMSPTLGALLQSGPQGFTNPTASRTPRFPSIPSGSRAGQTSGGVSGSNQNLTGNASAINAVPNSLQALMQMLLQQSSGAGATPPTLGSLIGGR